MQNIQLPPHLQGELWRRFPKPGRPGQPGGRLEGLSRTTLLELSDKGLIRTVAIRKPGAIKGIRLVYMPSLYSYLENLTTKEASV
jgi:hypothetical protein